MKNEDVKIGMKVVPFQKTAGVPQYHAERDRAEKKNQPFLYVVNKKRKAWLLNSEGSKKTGNYFNACDFEPYTEKKVITKNIKHIITGNKTIVVIQNKDGTYLKGEARCHSQDEFNEYEGFRIAYCRAIGKEPFEKSTMARDTDGNKKKIIDGRIKVNKDLWKLFLTGQVVIQCKTQKSSDTFLTYCKSMGVKAKMWDINTAPHNVWGLFKHNTCYSLNNSILQFDHICHCPKHLQVFDYNVIFHNNNVKDVLSQFTNEELLEELRIRMKK